MSLRIFDRLIPDRPGVRRGAVMVALVLLAACSSQTEKIAGSELISCRPAGKADFERSCTLEKTTTADGVLLIVRAPDGGFRRLLVVKDGRGVIAADGAEPVKVAPADAASIDVSIDGAVFRLPAKITP